MNLRGHSHYAQVNFEFRTVGQVGFPSFAHTHEEIQGHLIALTRKPFTDATNEDVLRQLFEYFLTVKLQRVKEYNCLFELVKMEMLVRGVPDDIGHADSFTKYSIFNKTDIYTR